MKSLSARASLMALLCTATSVFASSVGRTLSLNEVAPPLLFEVNRGQVDEAVEFVARARGYQLFLIPGGMVMSFGSQRGGGQEGGVVSLEFVETTERVRFNGRAASRTRVNYLLSEASSAWFRDIPCFTSLNCADVYPGIDAVLYGTERFLEFDFIIAPGADPNSIQLVLGGGESARIDSTGELVVATAMGELRCRRPVAFQEIDGERQEVSISYVVSPLESEDQAAPPGGAKVCEEEGAAGIFAQDGRQRVQVSFDIGPYDRSRQLVIDPVLDYATYLGGIGQDAVQGVAVDSAGNVFVVGTTTSLDFPLKGGFPSSRGNTNVFVAKFNAAGTELVYSTVFGGTGIDEGYAIAVDTDGRAVIMGGTSSTDLPTANALQPANGGGWDAFVAKLSADGSSFLFSTYLGGSKDEPYWNGQYFGGEKRGRPMTLGADGSIYLTGDTLSPDFPTVNAYQPIPGIAFELEANAFVTKLAPDGSRLDFSTYFGSGKEGGRGIALDRENNVLVCGFTVSPNRIPIGVAEWATPGAVFSVFQGGNKDAFVAKFSPDGSQLLYATYLGGGDNTPDSGQDVAYSVAADSEGNACVVGETTAENFPTVNAAQEDFGGGLIGDPFPPSYADAFVTKISPDGSSLVFSSYFGGYAGWLTGDIGSAIVVDGEDNAYITGFSSSQQFRFLNPLPGAPEQGIGAFVAKFSPAGGLLYSTSIAGGAVGAAIATAGNGSIVVAGNVRDGSLQASGGLQPANAGGTDGFIVRIGEPLEPIVQITSPPANSRFQVGKIVEIKVNAVPGQNPLARVEFYIGSVLIGSDDSSPFETVWTRAVPGQFSLAAVAFDTQGAKATHSVPFTVLTSSGETRTGYSVQRVDVGLAASVTAQGLNSLVQGVTAHGLNNLGQVVGLGITDERFIGFVWESAAQQIIRSYAAMLYGINDAGTAFGWLTSAQFPGDTRLALVARPDQLINLSDLIDPPFRDGNPFGLTGVESVALRVNDLGHAVGQHAAELGPGSSQEWPPLDYRAFFWEPGGRLVPLLERTSRANGINNFDQVVGYYLDEDRESRAFLWQDGTVTDLNNLLPPRSGWVLSDAQDINDAGQIVGTGEFNRLTQAFLFDGAAILWLGNMSVYRINRIGQVVGASGGHAALWQSGILNDLNLLTTYGAPSLTEAVDINDVGQIVCQTGSGPCLLTPAGPLRFLAPSRALAVQGRLAMQLVVPANRPFVIEASDDLKAWSAVRTNVSASGIALFEDEDLPIGKGRFYRAVLQE